MSEFRLLFFVPVIVFIYLCSLSVNSFNVVIFHDGINQVYSSILYRHALCESCLRKCKC